MPSFFQTAPQGDKQNEISTALWNLRVAQHIHGTNYNLQKTKVQKAVLCLHIAGFPHHQTM